MYDGNPFITVKFVGILRCYDAYWNCFLPEQCIFEKFIYYAKQFNFQGVINCTGQANACFRHDMIECLRAGHNAFPIAALERRLSARLHPSTRLKTYRAMLPPARPRYLLHLVGGKNPQ